MFNTKIKKALFSSAVTAFALFGLSGCLEEKPLPTDELVTLYNSNMEKTNKMHPLDTMYAKIGGLEANKRYEIKILDSNRKLITSSQVFSDESGVIEPTAIWYDIGLVKPTADTPNFHIKKELEVKSFYINVVDMESNGNDTDFYQAFFYVSTDNDTDSETHPKPIIYACNSNGVIENAFEETNTKDMNGDDSLLTKIHLKVDTLPRTDYATNTDISTVDLYVVKFDSNFSNEVNISDLNSVITLNDVNVSELRSDNGKLIWDLNDDNTTLINPNEDESAYSIILDLNKDGVYTVGVDIDSDGITDRFVDAVDGGLVPGFIVQNTPANETSYYFSNSAGEKISSVPECFNEKGGSVYLNIDNLTTSDSSLDVDVNGTNVAVDLLEPTGDDGRYLKYVYRAKIFDSCDASINVNDGETADISVNIDILENDDINDTIKVYSVITGITTSNGTTDTTVFDETGTSNGDTKIYLVQSGTSDNNASAYFLDSNVTLNQDSDISGELAKVENLNLEVNTKVEAFDLDDSSILTIKNPKVNDGMYKVVVDYDNDGILDNEDKILTVSIRDTAANDAPDVNYINIASAGMFYSQFDNHYQDSQNLSVYNYIDEFKKDGSNTSYGCCGSKKGVKAIWNPYIKNRSSRGWYRIDSSVSTYVDYSGDTRESPFNFGQRVTIYIIDAEQYELSANMDLDGKDIRGGYGTVVPVQYSCSNGASQQTIWHPNMTVGKYYMILDMDNDGKLTEGVDFVDAVNNSGETIKDDSSIVGFSVVE